jgi:predicted DNA binding CopG/RHH family protein
MTDKMVPLNTYVPEPLRTAVKITAAREGLTMQNWMIKRLEELTSEEPQEVQEAAVSE